MPVLGVCKMPITGDGKRPVVTSENQFVEDARRAPGPKSS
jgi:hypothetical protein